jgi:hypothetical protein
VYPALHVQLLFLVLYMGDHELWRHGIQLVSIFNSVATNWKYLPAGQPKKKSCSPEQIGRQQPRQRLPLTPSEYVLKRGVVHKQLTAFSSTSD